MLCIFPCFLNAWGRSHAVQCTKMWGCDYIGSNRVCKKNNRKGLLRFWSSALKGIGRGLCPLPFKQSRSQVAGYKQTADTIYSRTFCRIWVSRAWVDTDMSFTTSALISKGIIPHIPCWLERNLPHVKHHLQLSCLSFLSKHNSIKT